MGSIETEGEPERTQSASDSVQRPTMATGARPGCVTAYAALLGLVAISAAIVGLTTEFDFAILLWLGMAIPFGMVARSLWQMKNWARVLVIMMHGFGIFLLAVIAAGSVSDGWEPISVIATSMALSVWTVYWFATHGKMFMGTNQPAHLSESFAPRTFADGAASIVPEGRGWRCSACGGFVRRDACSCKTCHKSFQQSDLRSFLEGAQIDLGAISLVSASFVSIPLENFLNDTGEEHSNSDEQASREQIVEAVYAFAVKQMKNGALPQQIQAMLVEGGLDQQSAATVVSNLARLRSEDIREVGKKNMLYGALWCIGGIVVTVVSYSAASGGGTYIVAFGAIIFGAIQFFKGLSQSSSA